jgi:hypothetical protein
MIKENPRFLAVFLSTGFCYFRLDPNRGQGRQGDKQIQTLGCFLTQFIASFSGN